jgi:hypothetical protein
VGGVLVKLDAHNTLKEYSVLSWPAFFAWIPLGFCEMPGSASRVATRKARSIRPIARGVEATNCLLESAYHGIPLPELFAPNRDIAASTFVRRSTRGKASYYRLYRAPLIFNLDAHVATFHRMPIGEVAGLQFGEFFKAGA